MQFLFRKQRTDGSWFGEWGVCFLYAGFFRPPRLWRGARLWDCAQTRRTSALQRAVDFTLSKQNAQDGGWGESVESCALKTWVADPAGSNVVSTSWALLSLCSAIRAGSVEKAKAKAAVLLGARYLVSKQEWQWGLAAAVNDQRRV
ncbi:lanosterol synthase [Batrachochytrium salamandrivorans]|nr:lanosterol synthase [Batrachochytrium salamandrivorans]